jgi:branched-chain amino acid aminotransferase
VLVTPPVTDNILEGITRKTVMELARRELGIEVVERSIDRTEVYVAEEMFFSGTAAGVTIITKVDHRPVGSGKPGPVATKLKDLLDDAVRARNPKYEHWNVAV